MGFVLSLTAVIFIPSRAVSQNSGMKNSRSSPRVMAGKFSRILSRQLNLNARQTIELKKTAFGFILAKGRVHQIKDLGLRSRKMDSLDKSLDLQLKQILSPGQYQQLKEEKTPPAYPPGSG